MTRCGNAWDGGHLRKLELEYLSALQRPTVTEGQMRTDKSAHCDCGMGDHGATHSEICELVREGDVEAIELSPEVRAEEEAREAYHAWEVSKMGPDA